MLPFAPAVCTVVLILSAARAEGARALDDETLVGDAPIEALAPRSAAPELPQVLAQPFGARGEFVVTGASIAGIGWAWWDAQHTRDYSATFAPGLDLFIAPNVSVGLSLHVGYSDDHDYGADARLLETETTTLSGGIRIGWNFPLASDVSLYPRFTLGLQSVHSHEYLAPGHAPPTDGGAIDDSATTRSSPWFELFAPILFHPKAHFFVGAGPNLFEVFGGAPGREARSGQRTTLGAGIVVGGWWGGASQALGGTAPAPGPVTPARRFGRAHDIVVTGETEISANWTTRPNATSSSTIIAVAPTIDWFVTNRLSIGAALSFRSSDVHETDPLTGLSVSSSVVGAGAMLRIGADVPIASRVSFYPRGGIGLGFATDEKEFGGHRDKSTVPIVSVGLYAPLLLHFAPHAFIGFGPAVSREFSRSTAAGAGLVVGGWID